MSSVLNRTTKEYRRSANTPDYPTRDWIINPDISAVAGNPTKYWTISGDTVSLMSASERADVDAAETAKARDLTASDQVNLLAEAMLDEVNTLRTRGGLAAKTIDDLIAAVKGKYNG